MPLLEKKSVLTCKIEPTYGADSLPSGDADAVLVENLSITPLNQDLVARNSIQPYFGGRQQIESKSSVEISFDVEMSGSGTPGIAPAYAPLLRICGMSETLTAGESAVYNPVSSGIESGSFYLYADGVLHKAVGCRGTFSTKITAAQIPVYSFNFTGLYLPVQDSTLVTASLGAFKTPLISNSTNTPALSIHNYTDAVLSEMSFQMGNNVVHRNLIGSESVIITDRSVTGKIVVEAVKMSEKDFFFAAKTSHLDQVSITHGVGAGNIITISGAKVQLYNPTYSSQDDIRMLNLDTMFTPTSIGNDEITITYT